MVKKGFFMTLNQMFDFTPVYIYIVAAVQLFIGFSLSLAIGQILPLRIREFMYYLFSFLFLFIPFLYEIATANVQSGMRSFLFTSLFSSQFFYLPKNLS